MKRNQKRKSNKKQAGFLGLGIVELIAIVAGVLTLGATLVYPAIKNFNESNDAAEIVSTFAIINEAVNATQYATISNYAGLKWDDLPNLLPVGFINRAPNASAYTVNVHEGDNTKFDISLPIANPRLLERVKAKYTPTQYKVTENKITITGP